MPVKTSADRRTLAMPFDLPGTPEQVWQAIATGPGISSWFGLDAQGSSGVLVVNRPPGARDPCT